MRCTWSLPAPPQPATACLTSLGLYWTTGMPASAAAARARPLAWPTDMAVRALIWKRIRSTTTTSGESRARSMRSSLSSCASLSASGLVTGVVKHPGHDSHGIAPVLAHGTVPAARKAGIYPQYEH